MKFAYLATAAATALLLTTACEREPAPEIGEIETVTTMETAVAEPAPDAVITTVTDVVAIVDPSAVVERRVELTGLQVVNVLGDKAFLVDAGNGRTLLAVLDQHETPGTPIEGRVDVNAGQQISITGIVRTMPSIDDARSKWDLASLTDEQLAAHKVYIHADRVDIVETAGS